jgi:hypothetical protein
VVEESAEYARKRPVTGGGGHAAIASTSGDGNDKAAAIAAIYNDIQATTSAHLEGGEPKMKVGIDWPFFSLHAGLSDLL